ncbi:hypothetical protein HKX48_000993 [Thoreauomyces humboldtii]|nr:hypothetical protein HKX48_000993 [Thoreauomyces humboldtii]
MIVNEPNDSYEVSSMAALSEASRMKPVISKKDAESLIERLIVRKWLVDRNGLISMGLRTVLELQTYLKDQFKERIHECTLCLEILTSDYVRCTVANCQTRLHTYCSATYFRDRTEPRCPSCRDPWRGESLGTGRPVVESRANNAASVAGSRSRARRSLPDDGGTAAGRVSGSSSRVQTDDDDDDDGGEEGEEEEEEGHEDENEEREVASRRVRREVKREIMRMDDDDDDEGEDEEDDQDQDQEEEEERDEEEEEETRATQATARRSGRNSQGAAVAASSGGRSSAKRRRS